MTLRRISLILTITIVLFAVFAAACGDDTPEQAAEPVPSPSTAAQTQQASTPSSAAQTQQASTPSSAAQTQQASTPSSPMQVEPIAVVTTSNIVADWASHVGGDRVEVAALLPPGADPHTFQPGARDIAKVADADLVLTVGLALEAAWLDELIENATRDPESIVALGEVVDPIDFVELLAHDEDEMHDDHGAHDEDEHEDHDLALTGRLLVGDAEAPHLSVVDLMTDEVSELTFELPGPASAVYSSPGHRFGFVLYRGDGDNDDRVFVFDGGVYLVPHGDHEDLVTDPVQKMLLETTDERPIHFANAEGWTAIFNDGTGRAALFNEHEMEEHGDDYTIQYLNTGLQHGAAVPLHGDLFAVTVANPDYPDVVQSSLPIGVEIRDLNDRVVFDGSSESCPGMHGESHNHEGSMYGCVGGVLFIEKHDDHFDHWFIDNPANMREDSRIGSVYGHEDSHVFFGRASYRDDSGFQDDGIWMIDPEESTMVQVLAASEDKRSVSAAFSDDGETLFVLTYDGMLNAIDAHDGEVASVARLMERVDPEASPSFIIVGDMLFLTDRADEHVIAFSLEHMEVEHEWHVHGAPSRLAFMGVVGSEGHEEEGHDDDHALHDEDDEHAGHAHGEHDPHFWFDPQRVKLAVDEIANRLTAIDPDGADLYRSNAQAYNAELSSLNDWIVDQVSAVPTDRRLLVTSHDSFRYFAELYGFEVVGTVIPGLTTEIDPSPQEVAELIDHIREYNVPAIFTETTVSDTLAHRIADEAGASIVGELYTGSLGQPGGEAGTYLGFMRYNVATIVDSLR